MSAMINLSYTTSKSVKQRAVHKGSGMAIFTPSTSAQDLKVLQAIHMLDTFDRITIGNCARVPFGTASRVFSQLQNSGYIVRLHETRKFKLSELNAFPWPKGHRHNYDEDQTKEIGSAIYKKTTSWPKLMVALTKVMKPKRKKRKP